MFPMNEGPLDRVIRIVVGILLIPTGLFLLDGLDGDVFGVVVAVVGFGALVTGVTGRCVMYLLLGIDTLPKGEGGAARWSHGQKGTAH